MKFAGDTTIYGSDFAELCAERGVDTLVEEGEAFPLGVRGLLPVVTSRKKKGGYKTVYAFRFAEGEPDAADETANELSQAIDFANVLIDEASDLSGYPFAPIDTVLIGIPAEGYGFTRVEQMPLDENGNEPATPIHLQICASSDFGDAKTIEIVMEYDASGHLQNTLITENCFDGGTRHISAAPDWDTGEILVQRVLEIPRPGAKPRELYFRRHPRRDR